MGVGSGGCRRPSSDDDRSSRHRKNHARLAHSRHYESAQRIGTTGSRIDPLPMRHIAQLWHQRCSAIRSAAPYRIHRILGRRRRGIGSTRRDHAGASGHPIHGRAPEFSARTLQTLREPLESGYVAISRAKGTTYYPARFQLIMAANPCPCGYAYGNGERCTCREKDRIKYFSRLSGPILDRIDIQIEVPPVERINPGTVPSGESSHAIRLRVMVARQTAQERFREFGWVCNAQATGTWLRANTSTKAIELVNHALASERLSLRGADRAMRLAWTLSDLSGKTSPGPEEMMQGISMRTRLT
mgnify:CR=1 FL=1